MLIPTRLWRLGRRRTYTYRHTIHYSVVYQYNIVCVVRAGWMDGWINKHNFPLLTCKYLFKPLLFRSGGPHSGKSVGGSGCGVVVVVVVVVYQRGNVCSCRSEQVGGEGRCRGRWMCLAVNCCIVPRAPLVASRTSARNLTALRRVLERWKIILGWGWGPGEGVRRNEMKDRPQLGAGISATCRTESRKGIDTAPGSSSNELWLLRQTG